MTLLLLLSICLVASPDATGSDTLADQIQAAIDADKPADAVALVQSNSGASSGANDGFDDASPRLIATLISLARKCESSGLNPEAATVYHVAAASIADPSPQLAETLDASRRRGLWIAAAKRLNAETRPADALRWLTAASELAQQNDADSAWKPAIGEESLRCGAGLIDIHEFETAAVAYRLAIKNLDANNLATARLGLAWSLTIAGKDDAAAGEAIETFVKNHADHVDAPSAYLLRMTLANRRGDNDAIDQTRLELVQKFPTADATMQAVAAGIGSVNWSDWLQSATADPIAKYLADHHSTLVTRQTNRSALLASGLIASVSLKRSDAETVYATAIGSDESDNVGETVSGVLEQLVEAKQVDAAERIARGWLTDGTENSPISLAATEATCRWAGRAGHWEVLASVARDQTPLSGVAPGDAIEETRLHIARLYAESLTQTGRGTESLRWWEAIVDRGGANDFPTLLRLAESTVASGSIVDATVRLAKVRSIASPDSTQPSLVNLLAADIEVRQLQFDRGRALLESVVRSPQSDADLRGRAQWTIGETYFMQGKYAEAVDAYRIVESMTDNPRWVAASLVQAGKSFEQLGRTREAAVCYGTLVSRYGDSSYATGARDRLAALQPSGTEPTGVIRR